MRMMMQEEVAAVYDARAEIDFDGSTNRAELAASLAALATVEPSREARILDVGCGEGWFLAAMAAAGYRYIYGIDVSAKTLRKAAGNCAATTAILILGDIADAAHPSFDTITAFNACLGCFGPVGDQRFLDGMFRALAPGGHLLLTFIGPDAARRRVGEFNIRYNNAAAQEVASKVSIEGDMAWLAVRQKIGERSLPEERIRILDRSLVQRMLTQAGFECLPNPDAVRITKLLPFVDLAVAVKPR